MREIFDVNKLLQTSENDCIHMYQLFRLWAAMLTVTIHLGCRKGHQVDKFCCLLLIYREMPAYMYLICFALWNYDESLFILRHPKMSEI